MSDYSAGATERDAFLAAVGRVFAEYEGVSGGYAMCDLARLSKVMSTSVDEPVTVSRDDSGNLVTSSTGFPHPITEIPMDRCVVFIPHPDVGGLGDCIVYLTA